MGADRETMDAVLEAVPQQEPFRFIDRILELDETHIVGSYRFREDAFFYRGHFPGDPITPGVILIETMAQTGVVAFGLHLVGNPGGDRAGSGRMGDWMTLFTLAETVEFTGIVRPGERVVVRGEKIHFRRNNLKVRVEMTREGGEVVCEGILAGMGVKR